jgi:hypothetical protein
MRIRPQLLLMVAYYHLRGALLPPSWCTVMALASTLLASCASASGIFHRFWSVKLL